MKAPAGDRARGYPRPAAPRALWVASAMAATPRAALTLRLPVTAGTRACRPPRLRHACACVHASLSRHGTRRRASDGAAPAAGAPAALGRRGQRAVLARGRGQGQRLRTVQPLSCRRRRTLGGRHDRDRSETCWPSRRRTADGGRGARHSSAHRATVRRMRASVRPARAQVATWRTRPTASPSVPNARPTSLPSPPASAISAPSPLPRTLAMRGRPKKKTRRAHQPGRESLTGQHSPRRPEPSCRDMVDGHAWPCGACRQFMAEVRACCLLPRARIASLLVTRTLAPLT